MGLFFLWYIEKIFVKLSGFSTRRRENAEVVQGLIFVNLGVFVSSWLFIAEKKGRGRCAGIDLCETWCLRGFVALQRREGRTSRFRKN